MPDEPDRSYQNLAAMPGILVVITLGYLFVVHVGHLARTENRNGRGLEADYQEAGAAMVGEPAGRLRARLGSIANQVVQRDGELFFLPDIEHVMGEGFMAEKNRTSHVVLRREDHGRREANPLPAILDFDRQLRERGARLVILPVPSKAAIARQGEPALHNESYHQFLREMERHEIPVFDLAPHFAEGEEGGWRVFLRTDSHWTPEAMRTAAILLAAFLEREGLLPDGESEEFSARTEEVANRGDLAVLLEGHEGTRWAETIEVHPVLRRRDSSDQWTRWVPDRDSPVLLLGDSFTNIFSLAAMGWGSHGGFAETLSQSMEYPVDRIALNADGALASRRALRNEPGRLGGKELVVWQFAARELSFGDWRVLELPEAARPDGPDLAVAGAIRLEGTIAAVAPVPSLTRTPYRRAVMEVRLTDVRREDGAILEELVLLGLGVEDRKPTAMTKWRVGQRIRVRVVPWRQVVDQFGRLRRFALDDPELELLEADRYWMTAQE